MFYILRRRTNIDYVVDRYFKEHESAYKAFDEVVSGLEKNCLAKIIRKVGEFNSSKGFYMKETVLEDDEGNVYRVAIIETYFEDCPDE